MSLCAALISAAVGVAPALAQSASQADAKLYPDLPMNRGATGLGVTPGVGPTPGVIIFEGVPPRVRCSQDAIKAADGMMTPQDAVRTCNEAILSTDTAGDDLAGVHVNRGVLLVTMLQSEDAKRDFEQALAINPDLAEALANRGAIRVAEGRSAEGVADLDRAIALGSERPERAYYSRAIGREDLGDLRGAYQDYRMAQTLKPDWDLPATQLSRFQVRASR
jgi:tetratricopeptide (TPR) repeat protein